VSGRSVGSTRRRKELSTLQRKIILGTIREYMPSKELHNVVYRDIIEQMENLEKKNYPLPTEYDKHKHDISDNEIRLYEQQLQRDKHRDSKKVSGMIAISATCLSQFCQLMQIDYLKTKNLPKLIREAINDGEFDDYMEGLGEYLRGSVVDHPIFSIALKFVEKVGEAHNIETEEEQERLEEEEAQREKRHAESLRSLNKLRIPDVPSPKARVQAKKNVSPRIVPEVPKPKLKAPVEEPVKKKDLKKDELKMYKPPPKETGKKVTIEEPVTKVEPRKETATTVVEPVVKDEHRKDTAVKTTVEEPVVKEEPRKEATVVEPSKEEQPKGEQRKPSRPKKGFKKCNAVALPKGTEKLIESLQGPMQEIKTMMQEDQQIVTEDVKAQNVFHSISF
jgi:hypothetical protein